jgi:hypothetical protein
MIKRRLKILNQLSRQEQWQRQQTRALVLFYLGLLALAGVLTILQRLIGF